MRRWITFALVSLVGSAPPGLVARRTAAQSSFEAGTAGPNLAFGGDVLYDATFAYQLRRRAREVGRARAYREVFSDLAPSFEEADLSVVNLEVPVSRRYRSREPTEDLPVFRAPEDFLDALRDAGVEAVTVANNHAYDQGRQGLRETLRAAARRGLATIGAGADPRAAAEALILEVGGARVAIGAWTEGSNHRPRGREGRRPRIAFLRDGTMTDSLRRARQTADLVVAVFHWIGEERVQPRLAMEAAARGAAEAGADLVLGHGTHVPGFMEDLVTTDGRSVPVLYSLGNLLASMEEPAGRLTSPEVGVRDAPLAFVRTRWRNQRLEVAEVQIRHHWIARPTRGPWWESGHLPVSRPVRIDDELRRLSAANCGPVCDARSEAYRRRVELTNAAMTVRSPTHDGRTASSVHPQARLGPPSRTVAPPNRAPSREEAFMSPYRRGAPLHIDFPTGSALERSVDERALRHIAQLLRDDRSLRAEVVAHVSPAETAARAGLARRRARRVLGLIAMQGPSRSRFAVRIGPPGVPRVVIRLRSPND